MLVIDKSLIGVNNDTAFGGGGLNAALLGILNDSMNKAGYKTPEEHFVETVKYGAFLSNQRLVETLAIQAPARLLELQEFGIKNLRLREDITSRLRETKMLEIIIGTDACNGYGYCALACLANCIDLDYDNMKAFVTDISEYIVCRNCEEECPKQVIEVRLGD